MWLPFYHDMGLIGGLLQPLFVGMATTILPFTSVVQRPHLWLREISEFRANTSGGPNFAFDLCVEKVRDEDCAGLDLSAWDLAVNGAEPVRADTLDRFAAYGFRRDAFYPTYGTAETTLTGFDTTSAALFWTVHLLATHPTQQARLHNELDRLDLSAPTAERLNSAEYLQGVIHESLRLYPPVWYVGREVTRDTTLRGFDIPRGSFVLASPYVVHRNPRVWPDPLSFRPERFVGVAGPRFNLPGYLPFGLGARYCIGRPLAMHEIGIVISRLFEEFEFSTDAPATPDLLTC